MHDANAAPAVCAEHLIHRGSLELRAHHRRRNHDASLFITCSSASAGAMRSVARREDDDDDDDDGDSAPAEQQAASRVQQGVIEPMRMDAVHSNELQMRPN